jgi:hypothetical protein
MMLYTDTDWANSVSKVVDYKVDGQSSIPGKAKDFSFRNRVQTGSGVHPVS